MRAPLPRMATVVLLACAVAGPLVLHQNRFRLFALYHRDDFMFLEHALSWDATRSALWLPHHNHFCPLFRIFTRLLVAPADQLPDVAPALRTGPIVAFLALQLLVYAFTVQETGSAVAALWAITLMGFTSLYVEAIHWYSASAFLLALDWMLLALVALQHLRRWPGTLLAWLLTLTAPGWQAIGFVCGPVTTAYVLATSPAGWRKRLTTATLLATAPLLYLAAVRVAGGDQPLPADWSGRSVAQAFDPVGGVVLTGQLIVTNLVFRNLGADVQFAPVQVVVLTIPLFLGAVVWCRRHANRSLISVGALLVFLGYALPLSFRSDEGYGTLRLWSRYATFPQLGLVLIAVGGLRTRQRANPGCLYLDDTIGLLVGAVFLAGLHWPGVQQSADNMYSSGQRSELAELELLRQTSLRYGIPRDALRAALGDYKLSRGFGYDAYRLIPETPARNALDPADLKRRLDRVMEHGSIDAFDDDG